MQNHAFYILKCANLRMTILGKQMSSFGKESFTN